MISHRVESDRQSIMTYDKGDNETIYMATMDNGGGAMVGSSGSAYCWNDKKCGKPATECGIPQNLLLATSTASSSSANAVDTADTTQPDTDSSSAIPESSTDYSFDTSTNNATQDQSSDFNFDNFGN